MQHIHRILHSPSTPSSTPSSSTSIFFSKSYLITQPIHKYLLPLLGDLLPPHIKSPVEILIRLASVSLIVLVFPILPFYGMLKLLSFLRGKFGDAKLSIASKTKSIKNNKKYDDWKMIILVRCDLNMGKGKAAVQCCHSVLECYKQALSLYPSHVQEWEEMGQPKITLKVMNEAELNELVWKARKAGLPAQAIRDAGRTQLQAGTKTVASIGPGPSKMIDLITGHLKLY